MEDKADLNMVVGLGKVDIHFQAVLTLVHCHTKEHLVVDNFDMLVVVLDNQVPVVVGTKYSAVVHIDQVDFWVVVGNN